jgi:hypothetical protein
MSGGKKIVPRIDSLAIPIYNSFSLLGLLLYEKIKQSKINPLGYW